MKIFWKLQISEMAGSYILSVESHVDHDAAIENWLQPLFVKL